MATFRGIIQFETGNSANNRAYCYNRDGSGGYAFGTSAVTSFDQGSAFISISAGSAHYLQFSVDTGASNFGQANFSTLASNGSEWGATGVLEVTFAAGNKQLFIIKQGSAFFNGTDKLYFNLITLPPISP